MKMNKLNLQLFAEENLTTDLAPEISIDHVSKFEGNIKELQKVLGVTEMVPMSEGTVVKIYKLNQVNTPAQVAPGEVIPLTQFDRKVDRTIELELKFYRKETTAKAIQTSGKEIAINTTDERLVSNIQKQIKKDFFDALAAGTGTASGTDLQDTLSDIWGELQEVYEDEDASPIFFINPKDVSAYLGKAQVEMQQAFGFTYIETFLGLGTAVISPKVAKGKPIGTAKENLHGVFSPASSGDAGASLGLKADETGFVGMTHYIAHDKGNVGTLAMSGVRFYPELLDGVVIGTISETDA